MNRNNQTIVEHQFDRICKKAMAGEAYTCKKESTKRSQREVPLTDIYEASTMDIYEIEHNKFHYGKNTFVFKNDLLYEAVRCLQEEKRCIILLFYFLDMTDEEISKALNLIRRTVNYKRNKALKELRKILEDEHEKTQYYSL